MNRLLRLFLLLVALPAQTVRGDDKSSDPSPDLLSELKTYPHKLIYDLKTGKTQEHPNKKLHHLYTLNWSPDGNWFIATVHAGMGYSHGILAIEANGDKVVNLKLEGCRPNISPDGKKLTWGHGDFCAGVADLDVSGPIPL